MRGKTHCPCFVLGVWSFRSWTRLQLDDQGKRLEGSGEKSRSQTGHIPLAWDPKAVARLGATECWWVNAGVKAEGIGTIWSRSTKLIL